MVFASLQMTESVPQRCHGEQSPFAHQPVFREAWLRSLMSRDPCPNVLVQSPVMPVAAVAAELAAFCGHLQVCRVPGTLSLPEPSDRSLRRTFLIGDVAWLTPQQQFTLWDWMNNRDRRIQVVSITSVPLLPLVEDGRFFDSLFYQLNMICVITTE